MIKAMESGRGEAALYQIKVTLKWSKPPIWRRIVVREDMRLDRLHWAMQLAMGWTNSHLHLFRAGGKDYGVPDPEFADLGQEMLNEKRYTIADLTRKGKTKFVYEYDFGDSWTHEAKVEKVLPADARFKYPVCVAGANACPPEDCGGIPGYYEFVEAMGNPENEEHEAMKEWYGGDWDPERFDIDEVNRELKGIKA